VNETKYVQQNSVKEELDNIKKRYSRRENISSFKYSPLNPAMYMMQQEKERAIIKWLQEFYPTSANQLRLLEIGCGIGMNLNQFIKLGFNPEFLIGNELLQERVLTAKKNLPASTKIFEGNALELDFTSQTFDIIFQSLVFSSILNGQFQIELARKMWDWTKVGGGILWYDFTYNNPQNKDVRGVKFKRVKELFPKGDIKKWKITIAPPLSYIITKIHPSLYNVFNLIPFLRTHILCWIKK
jgi:SAM-dependent methyltransferase